MSDENEEHPLEKDDGLRGCFSLAGGVMGPCLSCAYEGRTNCMVTRGMFMTGPDSRSLYHHAENIPEYIYIPMEALEIKDGHYLPLWDKQWFHEVAGMISGCGKMGVRSCATGFRICAHCGDRCVIGRKGTGRGSSYMKRKVPITRAGGLIRDE